eukprot:425829-Hanusia_phi.AAC.2
MNASDAERNQLCLVFRSVSCCQLRHKALLQVRPVPCRDIDDRRSRREGGRLVDRPDSQREVLANRREASSLEGERVLVDEADWFETRAPGHGSPACLPHPAVRVPPVDHGLNGSVLVAVVVVGDGQVVDVSAQGEKLDVHSASERVSSRVRVLNGLKEFEELEALIPGVDVDAVARGVTGGRHGV